MLAKIARGLFAAEAAETVELEFERRRLDLAQTLDEVARGGAVDVADEAKGEVMVLHGSIHRAPGMAALAKLSLSAIGVGISMPANSLGIAGPLKTWSFEWKELTHVNPIRSICCRAERRRRLRRAPILKFGSRPATTSHHHQTETKARQW